MTSLGQKQNDPKKTYFSRKISINQIELKITFKSFWSSGETNIYVKIDLKKIKKNFLLKEKKNFHYKTPKTAKNDQN